LVFKISFAFTCSTKFLRFNRAQWLAHSFVVSDEPNTVVIAGMSRRSDS
jgi:hypothetical protein